MLQSTQPSRSRSSRSVRPSRSGPARNLFEHLDPRTLMTAAVGGAIAPPAPVQAAPAVTVQAQPTDSSQPAPLANASVHVGRDPTTNNMMVASYSPNGQPVAPTTINLNLFHDDNTAGPRSTFRQMAIVSLCQ